MPKCLKNFIQAFTQYFFLSKHIGSMFKMNSAAYLGDTNSEDGMRAAARVIHGCAACGAMGIAKGHKILHVIVVVNQAFRQICTQSNACRFPSFDFYSCRKTVLLSTYGPSSGCSRTRNTPSPLAGFFLRRSCTRSL